MTLVGTATFPSIGQPEALHSSMGDGAMIDRDFEPAAFRKIQRTRQLLAGSVTAFVRRRPGLSHVNALSLLHRVVRAGNEQYANLPNSVDAGFTLSVLNNKYPAGVVNDTSIGSTPLWLALAFALGIMVAFQLTITSSVRRHRRDLALLLGVSFQNLWTGQHCGVLQAHGRVDTDPAWICTAKQAGRADRHPHNSSREPIEGTGA
jgi:hypothetical protein